MPCQKFAAASLLFIALATSAILDANAQDWPQWRGVDRDGVLATPIKPSADGPKHDWTAEIAGGYSGPTVVDGKVYVMDRVTDPKQIERVHCFDLATGKNVWTHQYDATYQGIGYPAGPRASVIVEDGKAYSVGSMGHAFCFDAVNGNVIWTVDFNKDYKIVANKRMPIWGISASPLIVGSNVIFHVGGSDGACVVAIDRETGKEAWRSLEDRAQYSAPVVMKHAMSSSIICWTGDSVASLKPETGEIRWRYEFTPKNMPIGVATPVIKDNQIFVTSFYDGSLVLEVGDDGDSVSKVWSAVGPNEKMTKSLQSIISTPIWLGDYIYGVDSYGQLRCLDAKTGERIWENLDAVPKARWSTIHFVRNGSEGDTIWMFNERGEIMLGKLTPDGFEELSRYKIIDPTRGQLRQRGGVCWSHPAFVDGQIIVRNDKEMKAWTLGEK
ncbi:outer membrane protein assembly factor BamB family protein [Mariniblastus fucicola]|uniref:Quinoprotein ethanol dehydrogenase n=1 Tax=Mariniblastus fucicola TaxID=980251 RepID=A0A5B9PAS1_9BACT|nr:PQQ-binding-like beta-propeller repeat protein [Mariniblastus fucicola]QEG20201.1 Quinoprotein ethanol dehydrogenase precursor [Mariniblastus fucicola]